MAQWIKVLVHKHMHTKQNFNNNITGKLQTHKQKPQSSHAKKKSVNYNYRRPYINNCIKSGKQYTSKGIQERHS